MNGFLQYVAGLNNYDAIRDLRTDIDFLNYLCTDTLTKLRILGNPDASILRSFDRIKELKRDIDERLAQRRNQGDFEPEYTNAKTKYLQLEAALEDDSPNDPQEHVNEDPAFPANGGRRKMKAKKTKKSKKTNKSKKSSATKKTKGRKH
jgi:hypothetical protein